MMSNCILIGYTGRLLDAVNGTTIGVKGVGKDTSADIMQEMPDFWSSTTHRLSFASPLKDILCDMYDLDRSVWDTPENKEKPIPGAGGWTFRRLCEVFGTNVVRDRLGQVIGPRADSRRIWVNLVLGQIGDHQRSAIVKAIHNMFKYTAGDEVPMPLFKALTEAMASENMPPLPPARPMLIQVTDVRYFNEYEALKARGATIICVQRQVPIGPQGPVAQGPPHPSNVYDERMVPDYVVENNGTMGDLRHKLDAIAYELVGKADVSRIERVEN